MIEQVSWFLCRHCAARWQVPEWDERKTTAVCPACGCAAQVETVADEQAFVAIHEQVQAMLCELKAALLRFTVATEQLVAAIKGGNDATAQKDDPG
jgi:transcription initiation factor TFIIIB Brf1 subunit/transcription initiation factor TFIIB